MTDEARLFTLITVVAATNLITWLVVYTYMRDKYVGLLRELASDRRAAEGQTRNIKLRGPE